MQFESDIFFRKQCLTKLLHVIEKHEEDIIEALHTDFKKSAFETYLTEIHIVVSELKFTIKNLNKWAKPKMVLPSLLNFPSLDYIYPQPYGKVLILAPWNYPFQLALAPAIAAIAAGNSVVIKPSELTVQTSTIIAKIISEVFEKNHVEVVQGGIEATQALLAKKWDFIFFTGSTNVGKIIAQAAAQQLTPVTLELGGKNPCIIDQTVNLKVTAKRIVWGKFVNAGQTCLAPDYLIVEKSIKDLLVQHLIEAIELAYSANPETSNDYPRIINQKNWNRLIQLLQNQKILYGGTFAEADFYFSPTIIDQPEWESVVMKEEIFGPILPILTYENTTELDSILSKIESPLALYVFSKNQTFANTIVKKYRFGGGCINDTLLHFVNNRLPFGGVGQSGMGAYHGKKSFDTFTHFKAIVKKPFWLDIPLRYAPYKNKILTLKKMLKRL